MGQGLGNLFKVLLFIFSLMLVSTAHAGHVVLINALPDDNAQGNSDYFEEFNMRRLSEQFPESLFIVIRSKHESKIRKELEFLVNNNTVIDGLVVFAHGVAPEDNGGAIILSNDVPAVEGDLYLNLLNKQAVERLFGPILGKFSEHAKIIVNACALLNDGQIEDTFNALLTVANNFGLFRGAVYMNSTNAVHNSDVIIRQPFQKQPTFAQGAITLGMQVLTPITYPVMLFSETFVYNRGYSLVIEEKDGALEYRLHDDTLFNAQENRYPKYPDALVKMRLNIH